MRQHLVPRRRCLRIVAEAVPGNGVPGVGELPDAGMLGREAALVPLAT